MSNSSPETQDRKRDDLAAFNNNAMAQTVIHNARIAGCSLVTGEIAQKIDDVPEYYNNDPALLTRLKNTIGFGTRRFAAQGTTTADLCRQAAAMLLEQMQVDPLSVDAIISVTQTPDHIMPGNAHVLHASLGFGEATAAVDVELGCSGYVYGLWLSAMMVSAGLNRVLLVAGDSLSKLANPHDRTLAPLFGDAGSATLIERDENAAPMFFILRSEGRGLEKMFVEAGAARHGSTADTRQEITHGDGCVRSRENLFMDGFAIFEFTMGKQPALLRDILAFANTDIPDTDFFILHQANRYIVETITKKTKIPPEKAPSTGFGLFGNQNSASIPGVLCGILGDTLKGGGFKTVLQGFGAGLSWGACHTVLNKVQCLAPVIYGTKIPLPEMTGAEKG